TSHEDEVRRNEGRKVQQMENRALERTLSEQPSNTDDQQQQQQWVRSSKDRVDKEMLLPSTRVSFARNLRLIRTLFFSHY
ncbi:hypothetical protein CDV36_015356, partial [Fusarium kuroshium]